MNKFLPNVLKKGKAAMKFNQWLNSSSKFVSVDCMLNSSKLKTFKGLGNFYINWKKNIAKRNEWGEDTAN